MIVNDLQRCIQYPVRVNVVNTKKLMPRRIKNKRSLMRVVLAAFSSA